MSNIKLIGELAKVFPNQEDIELIVNNLFVISTDDFMKQTDRFKDGQVVHVVGAEKRLTIARKRSIANGDKMRYTLHLIELNDAPAFFAPFLAEKKGVAPPPPPPPPLVEEEPLEEEIVEDENQEGEQQEEQPLTTEKKKKSESTSAGVCRYGVPILAVKRVVPNVVGLKESLTVDIEQEELDAFLDKVRGRVLRKVRS